MEQVTHLDQTSFFFFFFDNINLICDILDISKLLGFKTGLVFIDQEKAFDQVKHQYLWKVLESFGFNLGLMIKVLYSNIESVLKVNGSLCVSFGVHGGIRERCSLSGILYILAIDSLLCKIRGGEICGLSLGRHV